MSMFMKQYGMIVIYAMIGILIIAVLYGVFQTKWKSTGIVEDGIKADYSEESMTFKKPLILAENQKVKVGESINDVRQMAKASDIDETEIESSKITVNEIEGEILKEDFSLSTNKPAKSVLEYKVTGKNGNSVSRRITVLVD